MINENAFKDYLSKNNIAIDSKEANELYQGAQAINRDRLAYGLSKESSIQDVIRKAASLNKRF